jgi:hypothetical protein
MQEQAQSLTEAVAVFKLAHSAAPVTKKPQSPQVEESPAERRSPARAKNVARLPAKPKAKPNASESSVRAKTGTDDEWSEF